MMYRRFAAVQDTVANAGLLSQQAVHLLLQNLRKCSLACRAGCGQQQQILGPCHLLEWSHQVQR